MSGSLSVLAACRLLVDGSVVRDASDLIPAWRPDRHVLPPFAGG